MQKKIGPIRLSGLIIGPVLGSGIILLPPVAYKLMGSSAIYAWLLIMGLGIVFGYVFTRLSILSPGNEGVSIAIGRSLGPFYRELASNFIISAVCFGPVAVLMTAAVFIQKLLPWPEIRPELISMMLLVFCGAILLKGLRIMSIITLVLSTLTAAMLVAGSIHALMFSSQWVMPEPIPSVSSFGFTLLLLFWAIVGWEIVGNYVEDVENPRKTLLQGMKIGMGVITGTYLLVSLAMQNLRIDGAAPSAPDAVLIMTPLFGKLAAPAIGLIASGLCIATYLMIVGGISRLIQAKAETGRMPALFIKMNGSGTPVAAIAALATVHTLMTVLLYSGLLHMEDLVTTANVFFIGNAVLGLTAAFRLMNGKALRVFIGILILTFCLMLLFSDIRVNALVLAVSVGTAYAYGRTRGQGVVEEVS